MDKKKYYASLKEDDIDEINSDVNIWIYAKNKNQNVKNEAMFPVIAATSQTNGLVDESAATSQANGLDNEQIAATSQANGLDNEQIAADQRQNTEQIIHFANNRNSDKDCYNIFKLLFISIHINNENDLQLLLNDTEKKIKDDLKCEQNLIKGHYFKGIDYLKGCLKFKFFPQIQLNHKENFMWLTNDSDNDLIQLYKKTLLSYNFLSWGLNVQESLNNQKFDINNKNLVARPSLYKLFYLNKLISLLCDLFEKKYEFDLHEIIIISQIFYHNTERQIKNQIFIKKLKNKLQNYITLWEKQYPQYSEPQDLFNIIFPKSVISRLDKSSHRTTLKQNPSSHGSDTIS
jgi:hypothetical protein